MHTSACSSCGRAIIWTSSPTGARLPLDARAVTVYAIESSEETPDAVKIPHDAPVYISHWLTCPSADQHRRAK